MPPWRLWDPRVLTEQARRQGMRLRWDNKHYLPIAYEVTEPLGPEAQVQLQVATPTLGTAGSRERCAVPNLEWQALLLLAPAAPG